MVSFSMSCKITEELDFGGMLAQIALKYLLVIFSYCSSKDAIKSWGVPDRKFLE